MVPIEARPREAASTVSRNQQPVRAVDELSEWHCVWSPDYFSLDEQNSVVADLGAGGRAW
jgi:hypothetical protein